MVILHCMCAVSHDVACIFWQARGVSPFAFIGRFRFRGRPTRRISSAVIGGSCFLPACLPIGRTAFSGVIVTMILAALWVPLCNTFVANLHSIACHMIVTTETTLRVERRQPTLDFLVSAPCFPFPHIDSMLVVFYHISDFPNM